MPKPGRTMQWTQTTSPVWGIRLKHAANTLGNAQHPAAFIYVGLLSRLARGHENAAGSQPHPQQHVVEKEQRPDCMPVLMKYVMFEAAKCIYLSPHPWQ